MAVDFRGHPMFAPGSPSDDGRPSRAAIRQATAPADAPGGPSPQAGWGTDSLAAAVSEASRTVARVPDYHELENLQSAYGYYLDKNLWSDLADLFSEDSSMALAQGGVYTGLRTSMTFRTTIRRSGSRPATY